MQELSMLETVEKEVPEIKKPENKSDVEIKEGNLSFEEAHDLANMMRAKIGVDASGTITDPIKLEDSDTGGMPIYPSKEQYQKAFEYIEELEKIIQKRKFEEKELGKLKKIASLGEKAFFKFLLSLSFSNKNLKKFQNEIKDISENEYNDLKEKGDDFGQKEIQLKKDIEKWNEEEEEYNKY